MNYKRIYESIVARGKERVIEGYKERHHIIPRCMGGTDDPINLVDLTPEEHFVCHQLLVKIYPERPRLIHAVVMMAGLKHRRNKLYGWHRRRAMLPRKEQFIKHCDHCGCEMKMTKRYFDEVTYPRRWCSRNCRTEAGNVTKPCQHCGELFTSKKNMDRSFCSPRCYTDSILALRTSVCCLHCSKTFQISDYYRKINKKFCSNICNKSYRKRSSSL